MRIKTLSPFKRIELMNSDLSKEINRVSNLKQNTELSENQVEKQAKINLKIREFKKSNFFADDTEAKLAETKFKSYLSSHDLESFSELNNLETLVQNEIQEKRLLDKLTKIEQGELLIDDKKLIDSLKVIQDLILKMKIHIGIDREDIKEDELSGFEILKKRYHNYIQENKNEFTTCCAKCGNLLLLRRRLKDFDCLVHPWFAGRWYFNYEILKDVKEDKISTEQASRYCQTSERYIEYCLEHWSEITSNISKKNRRSLK